MEIKPVLYGGYSENVCGYCWKHRKWVTPTQLKQKKCLQYGCDAFEKKEHRLWDAKAKSKEMRKLRKEEMERKYIAVTSHGEMVITRQGR